MNITWRRRVDLRRGAGERLAMMMTRKNNKEVGIGLFPARWRCMRAKPVALVKI
jgi:hypothetical protein